MLGDTVTFTPDPELADLTEAWAETWSERSRASAVVGTGGIPVLIVDEVIGEEGTPICGGTQQWLDASGLFLYADFIEITKEPLPGCPATTYTVGHEMGHALGAITHCPPSTPVRLMQLTLGENSEPVLDQCSADVMHAQRRLGPKSRAPHSVRSH